MTTELAHTSAAPLARNIRFTPDQIQLVKTTICRGSTDDELKLFLYVCEQTGFNPFLKQIHAVKRWDKAAGREVMAIQVGIDGFRLAAERTGQYRGQVGPQWCGQDGAWRDIWLSQEPPAAARVGVLREGFQEPLWGVAIWSEYAQTKKDGSLTSFWQDMPAGQLAKCAEALAFRKGFPQELGHVYSPEEIQAKSWGEDKPPIKQPKALAPRTVEARTVETPAGENEVRGTLVEIVPASGQTADTIEDGKVTKKGRPWTRYDLTIEAGDNAVVLSTFDKKLGEGAGDMLGQPVVARWEKSARGNSKLISLAPGGPPQDQAEPGSEG